MTLPTIPGTSGSGGSSDPNGFLSYVNSLSTSSTNQDPKEKVNTQGQLDIYGIGENSGAMLNLGSSTTTEDDANNSPGGIGTRERLPRSVTTVNSTTTDDYWKQLLVLSQTDPQAFVQIQQGLYEAGYYGNVNPADVRFGIAGQKTKDALFGADGAITQYLQMVRGGATVDTFNDWLNKQMNSAKADPYAPGNGGGAAGSSGSAAKTFNPSSPDLISQQGDAMAQQELGHSLDRGQTNQLIGQVQNQEQDAYNKGDYYLRGVTPASLARDFIVQNNLPEYAQHQAESFMNVFANMFLNGQSQRAKTTVGDVAIGNTPLTPAPAGV